MISELLHTNGLDHRATRDESGEYNKDNTFLIVQVCEFECFAYGLDSGVLVQTNNAERRRVYAYEEYLFILRKDT